MSLQNLKPALPQVNIHPLAEVKSTHIGDHTNIWQFSVVMEGAVIGRNCNISSHTFVESDVIIGDNVTVKSGVFIWNGIRLEDDVFVGPSVVFTNGLRPRSKQYKKEGITIVKKGATLGANTSLLTGITIGKYAMTGMGSVVTKDVPPYGLVYGNPARLKGWVDEQGRKLIRQTKDCWKDEDGNSYLIKNMVVKPQGPNKKLRALP